jgi:hypothetical protein
VGRYARAAAAGGGGSSRARHVGGRRPQGLSRGHTTRQESSAFVAFLIVACFLRARSGCTSFLYGHVVLVNLLAVAHECFPQRTRLGLLKVDLSLSIVKSGF